MDPGKVFEKKPGMGLNPYLPEYEYIPDGEPHVFGNRVYIYGSHDNFGGKIFCLGDYISYSAPVTDLTKWRYEGVIYTKTQDPRMKDGSHTLWAPDVVRGKDGRYYLYYCPDDSIKSIGVAVCDTPAGKYEFYGIVQDKNGGLLGERPGDTYYLVYSSANLHQLCYAVSSRPDGDYRYGGVLISNAELFEDDEAPAMKNCWGNNHGSIEMIDGQYYIFYHVPTNRSMYSRQGRAERIELLPDGHFRQAHMTSQGLNGSPLPAQGTWPASCVCVLPGKAAGAIAHPLAMGKRHPYVTQDGEDFAVEYRPEDEEPPRQYITNGKAGLTAVFRYFDVKAPAGVSVTLRGNMKGELKVRTSEKGEPCGVIPVSPSADWRTFGGDVKIPAGVQELCFTFEGRGKLDMLEFTFLYS